MKRLFLFLCIFTCLLSCSTDDINSSTLIGKWKLDQVLVDPGDGSGTFRDVKSNKTIDFLRNETFSSNGNICDMFSVTSVTSSGTFSNEEELIYPANCDPVFGDGGLNFSLENGALIIYYQCIEACAERYVKIE